MAGGEGDDRGWNGWMASPTRWTWVWLTLGVCDGQEGLPCCSPWGCKELDITEQMNCTERKKSQDKLEDISKHMIMRAQHNKMHGY